MIHPLGKLSVGSFLKNYWERRPLLIRDAFPGFRSPITPDELAGLACEEHIESRIVLEHGNIPWELRRGPFGEDDFASLPPTHWTLLVQDVEKHMPELLDIMQPFRFLPNWRMDDLMISYAVPGGSVGPHTDNYDVFLLQAHGQRRWQISEQPFTDRDLMADIDLRILKNFRTEQEWVLNPGDMLYLPPGVAHYGVAVDECMTFSIGLRAPNQHQLVNGFADLLAEQPGPNAWYRDPPFPRELHPGELRQRELTELRKLLRNGLARDDATLDRWLARICTQPKTNFLDKAPKRTMSLTNFQSRLGKKTRIKRNAASLCCFIDQGDKRFLYFDAEEFALSKPTLHLAELLTNRYEFSVAELFPRRENDATWRLLLNLYNLGHLYF